MSTLPRTQSLGRHAETPTFTIKVPTLHTGEFVVSSPNVTRWPPPCDFAVVSACRGEHPTEENLARSDALRREIQQGRYRFVEFDGSYIENRGTALQRRVYEKSFLVMGDRRERLMSDVQLWGARYGQEAVLVKKREDADAYLVGTARGGSPGEGVWRNIGPLVDYQALAKGPRTDGSIARLEMPIVPQRKQASEPASDASEPALVPATAIAARPHWLDVVTNWTQGTGKLFREGMGAPDAIDSFWRRVNARAEPSPAVPTWTRHTRHRHGVIHDGWFESVTPGLPDESRRAFIRFLEPRGPMRGVCVHLGGMAEMGWARRDWTARPLLQDGIGSVLLEYAYYGRRRPAAQSGYWLRQFADQVRLLHAAVDETAALLAWLRPDAPHLAIMGYSMGATAAAYAATALPWPTSVFLAAGGASSVPLLTQGLIQRLVCWSALGGEETALAQVLDDTSLIRAAPPLDPSRAWLLGFRRDGIVPPENVRALHRHWRGSRLEWVDTGHIGGFFRGIRPMRAALRAAILGEEIVRAPSRVDT